MTGAAKPRSTASPLSEEIVRLNRLGFSLVPLGGGDDGKSPLTSFKGGDRIPVRQVLGILHGRNSATYGIRLSGLAVIDCDDNDPELVQQMEARFGTSAVHVATPRGIHLYYLSGSDQVPNLRADGLPVDIKQGASSYVVGPHSIRPDGGRYRPIKGVLGVDDLSQIISGATAVRTKPAVIPSGNRNRELTKSAIVMVEAVEGPDELYSNLAFIRDHLCEDPSSLSDDELHRIAEWAWIKRLEGNVYHDRNSEFRISRVALDRLATFNNASDALALFVVLQSNHGHIAGKTFVLDHKAMLGAGHTSLGRRRFEAAKKTLLSAGLLGIAKEYSAGHSRRHYRLLRFSPVLQDVHPLFTAKR